VQEEAAMKELKQYWPKGSRKRIVQDKKTGQWRLFQKKQSFLYSSIKILGSSMLIAKTSAPFTPRIETREAIEGFPIRQGSRGTRELTVRKNDGIGVNREKKAPEANIDKNRRRSQRRPTSTGEVHRSHTQ
jgi:hypothetical protein